MKNIIIPPYLQKGATIGIVCPSGYMPKKNADTCIQTLQNWGFNVKIGKTLGLQNHYFAGTDAERLHDLQTMLDDSSIDLILCGRGGYGMSRIIDDLNFDLFAHKPKWIVGYSDITLLHGHINRNYNIASLHSPMAGAFNNDGFENQYIQSLHSAITGINQTYIAHSQHDFNHNGEAKAPLIGGNLTMLTHAIATNSDYNYDNKILFLEDVGEYIYSIDRLFLQLKRSGKLEKLKGLIIGSFSDMKDTTISFGKSVQEAIAEHLTSYDYPIGFDFPVGHTDQNYALKLGVNYKLSVQDKQITLEED